MPVGDNAARVPNQGGGGTLPIRDDIKGTRFADDIAPVREDAARVQNSVQSTVLPADYKASKTAKVMANEPLPNKKKLNMFVKAMTNFADPSRIFHMTAVIHHMI